MLVTSVRRHLGILTWIRLFDPAYSGRSQDLHKVSQTAKRYIILGLPCVMHNGQASAASEGNPTILACCTFPFVVSRVLPPVRVKCKDPLRRIYLTK